MQRNRSPLWWRTNHVQACIVSSFASMPDYSWCRRTLSCSARRSVHAVVCHRDSSQCKFNFGQPGKHKSHVVFANTSARRVNIVATCVLLRGWIASVLDVYYFNVLCRKRENMTKNDGGYFTDAFSAFNNSIKLYILRKRWNGRSYRCSVV